MTANHYRRVVLTVALLNLAYFGIEFAVALAIGSVALFADSIDFLEDASINFLVLAAAGWTATRRAHVGRVLALILLVPGIATLWTAWLKFGEPVAPAPLPLALTAVGALAVNLTGAYLLARFRSTGGSLNRAAFVSSRNDAVVNVTVIGAAIVTATVWLSPWPDVIVGLGIAGLNADASIEVWRAARAEGHALHHRVHPRH